MRTIFNIIRADLISIFCSAKGRATGAVLLILSLIPVIVIGLLGLPEMLIIFTIVYGIVISQLILSADVRNGDERLMQVLPVARYQIVAARFILGGALFSAVTLIISLAMRISIGMGLSGDSILTLFTEAAFYGDADSISPSGFANILISVCYLIGLTVISVSLKNRFMRGLSAKKNNLIRTVLKVIVIYALIAAAIALLNALSDIPVVSTALMILTNMFTKLGAPAEGLLLSSAAVVIGIGIAVYEAVYAVIEFDEREL